METLKLLHARQAVRQYTGQLTDEQLQTILAAGNAAPVGMGNYADYRLIVIQDPQILQQTSQIYAAPTVIVVAARQTDHMTLLSAGIIAHNLELAAEDLGLGANYNLAGLASIPHKVLPAGFTAVFSLTLGQTTQPFTPRQIPADRIKTKLIK